jgi:hypothetical protein
MQVVEIVDMSTKPNQNIRRAAVITARDILNLKISMLDGCRQLQAMRCRSSELDGDWFLPIVVFESETDHLPGIQSRDQWAASSLVAADIELDEHIKCYGPSVRSVCYEIISRFA